ncbi:hypothetical protein [Kovacikia minuta]|nr:hypothetical protein [Kovacikia minuta]
MADEIEWLKRLYIRHLPSTVCPLPSAFSNSLQKTAHISREGSLK